MSALDTMIMLHPPGGGQPFAAQFAGWVLQMSWWDTAGNVISFDIRPACNVENTLDLLHFLLRR